uniref:Uncharacterized protein n=1 Tax=Panagrolaimus superbus TaxID=310955 RepID=A0A914Z4X2_9BILA
MSVENELKERLKTLVKADNYKPFIHDGIEEVPCVFSGDKAKDQTTVVMGVGSTKCPVNSPGNCSQLGYFKGNDSQSNLYAAFGDSGGLAEQIDKIKELQVEIDGVVRTFKIRWFVLGDFKFLNAIAGLNTNSASFPCWGCEQKQETTYGELDLNEKASHRTMNVNKEFSQIRLPLFKSIPFDHYIPPILHITLGPGAQLFEALCERARELDAAKMDNQDIKEMLPTERVKKSWQTIKENIEHLKEEIEQINYVKSLYGIPPDEARYVCDSTKCYALHANFEINNIFENEHYCIGCSGNYHKCCLHKEKCPNCEQKFPTSKQSQNIIEKQRKETEKKLKQTSKLLKEEEEKANAMISKFKLGQLATNVETVFEKYGGSRKAFFQEFTGKQLNKMGSNIHAIFFALDEELKHDQQIQKITRGIIQFFNIKKMLTTKILNDDEINDIEEGIKDFAEYMKANLPHFRVLQKGHVFFKHLPEYIRKFHIAAFFIDECIESFHVIINNYMRRIGNRRGEICAKLLFNYNKEDTWLHDTFSHC